MPDRAARCHRLQLYGARVPTPVYCLRIIYNRENTFGTVALPFNAYIRVDLSKWNYIYIKFEVWKFRSIHVPRRGSTRSRSLDKRTAAKLCSLKQDFQKGKKNAPFFFKVCTRERNKKCCDSSVDDTVYIEYATRANTRIVVLVHANSRMQVQRTVVVGRVVVTVVARCSRISRPKTRRWNCWRSEGRIGISSPLFAHKIHILRRKQHALRRVKNFVDHVVSEATPFSPSQLYTLSRPPSGVCKLCRARAEITFERTASPDDIRLPRKLGIFNSAIWKFPTTSSGTYFFLHVVFQLLTSSLRLLVSRF